MTGGHVHVIRNFAAQHAWPRNVYIFQKKMQLCDSKVSSRLSGPQDVVRTPTDQIVEADNGLIQSQMKGGRALKQKMTQTQ